VKASKAARCHQTHEKNAQSENNNLVRGTYIELANTTYENVTNRQIEKSPEHVHGRRRKPLAWRSCEWALKGSPHHSANKMRNGVAEEHAAEEIR